MKNFIQPGKVLTFEAHEDVNSGALVNIGGALYGVAQTDVPTGENGEAAVCGVFALPKASTHTAKQGDAARWSGTEITSVETDALIGVLVEAAEAGSTTVPVLLIAQAALASASTASE